jgi:hypothetical protein
VIAAWSATFRQHHTEKCPVAEYLAAVEVAAAAAAAVNRIRGHSYRRGLQLSLCYVRSASAVDTPRSANVRHAFTSGGTVS